MGGREGRRTCRRVSGNGKGGRRDAVRQAGRQIDRRTDWERGGGGLRNAWGSWPFVSGSSAPSEPAGLRHVIAAAHYRRRSIQAGRRRGQRGNGKDENSGANVRMEHKFVGTASKVSPIRSCFFGEDN